MAALQRCICSQCENKRPAWKLAHAMPSARKWLAYQCGVMSVIHTLLTIHCVHWNLGIIRD
jgi:hypothetical protein